jgi:protein O-GlcNAc transferase
MHSDIHPQRTTELQQAVAFHQAGQLQEAQALYRAILQTRPNHPEASHNMGVLAVQMNQAAAGLSYLLAALEADPACRQYWLSYIDALFQAEHLEEARQVLALARQQGLQGPEVEALVSRLACGTQPAEIQYALPVQPENPVVPSSTQPRHQEIDTLVSLFGQGRLAEATTLAQAMTVRYPLHGFGWKVLGMIFNQTGQSAHALTSMQKAVALSPGDATAHCNLGNTLHDLGRLEEACASYLWALQIQPDSTEVHNNLGNTLKDMKRLDEAEASFRQALHFNPDLADAHYNLANTLKCLGRFDEAEVSYRRALQIKPDWAVAHNNLGITLRELGWLDEAEASFRLALQVKPDYGEAHYNLSLTLNDLFRLDEAEVSCRRALQINPNLAEALNNLACIMQKRGQLDDAVAYYRRALQIRPDYAMAHSNLIFCLDMKDTMDLPELQRERNKWGETHAAPLWRDTIHANDRSPARRLRIGYVSADFREHSAPKAFGGMLTRYDRSQFDVFAYSNFKGKDDRFTDLFRQSVTVWRNIGSLSDEVVATMIREDQIDILVDLSGHSGGNRLLVFARKPAPIQITAWGYAVGTGMRAMDVFFTDPVMVPPQEQHYFIEKVRYLPCALGSFFIDQFPDVNELPALKDGIITFGSLNRLAKVSDNAYRVWADILRATPGSRLILKTAELNDAAIRERVIGHFTEAGVAADRIIMQGKTSWYEHMQANQHIDIALDSFPQGGGVTALEGLMMGVPIITLHLPTISGRVSASLMTTLGLTDWIAETQEQYVELAIQKAGDLQHLATLRQQLRGIFTSSIIGDQAAYARAVEKEYKQLWQEWCSPSRERDI